MPIHHTSHPPYIPVIKWQKAEQRALSAVAEELTDHVWPCIEVRGVTYHELLMSEVYHYWKGTVLVDYADPSGRLIGRRMSEFESFLTVAGDKNYPIIPVIDSRDALELNESMHRLLSTFETVVIRLRLEDFALEQDHLTRAENACEILGQLKVEPRLIVDLGECPATWSPESLRSFADALGKLKELGFQTVHLTSGAYPESLVEVASKAEYDRNDWKLWKELNAAAPEIGLGYSDYGILSPKWTEEILKKIAKKVALRYTRAKDWLILKATGKRKQDSIDLSVILVNQYAEDFKGGDFSLGDRQMAIRADDSVPDRNKKSGATAHLTEAWIHHIAFVVKEQY